MKTKIVQFIPAALTLGAIGFSYFSQWCAGTGQICFRTVIDQMIPEITYPLFFFAVFFLPIAIVLAFVPRSMFNSWLKLAAWAIPLLILFIATQPVYPGSPFSTDRDDAARLAGGVFASVSLILIIWKAIITRRT